MLVGAKPPGIIDVMKEITMQNQKMNEKKPRDIIAIYSPRMAGYLMMRGFYLVGVSPNKKQPGKNCFAIFDSPILKDAMEDYINNKQAV